jgi:hypothetical protein
MGETPKRADEAIQQQSRAAGVGASAGGGSTKRIDVHQNLAVIVTTACPPLQHH